jgi:PAS domain S-box-containing protein
VALAEIRRVRNGDQAPGEGEYDVPPDTLHWLNLPVQVGATLLGRLIVLRDITERRRMEQEIRAQRDFAMQVMNAMGQGLTVTDAEGRFEYVNPAYARLCGYSPADLIGKYSNEVTLPEDHAILAQARAQRREGKATTYETRLVRADGSLAYVLIAGTPRWHEGRVVGTIAAITDLTKRKQMEQALSENEERFRTLVENQGEGTGIVDVDEHFLFVNPAAEEILGAAWYAGGQTSRSIHDSRTLRPCASAD